MSTKLGRETAPMPTARTDDGDGWDRPDRLYHLPLDALHERRAERGMTWRTLCGQMRPPSRGPRMSLGDLPDDCQRCTELGFGNHR